MLKEIWRKLNCGWIKMSSHRLSCSKSFNSLDQFPYKEYHNKKLKKIKE